MKYVILSLLFIISLINPAFAEEVAAPVADVISNDDFIKLLLESIGGIKGASTLVIVGIVIKLLLAFLNTEFAGKIFKNMKGSVKLLIVSTLTLVGGVIGLMTVSGLDFGAALMHSTTLNAFLVFVNQIYKQFFEKKD